jgi:ubiquitin carboxyl-terminal hydrolase 25/28
LDQTEIKGTDQMDVEEVMGRCINHLRAAINPASVTNTNESDNAQKDKITENLYITFATWRKEVSAAKWNRSTSEERWVTANPATSGSIHLYNALDNYFDREVVGSKLMIFTSIVTAPPIFHICIQRSQVGGGKNTNSIVIPQVLYLDRYMESQENSALFKARKRGWDLKTRLQEIEHPPMFDIPGEGDGIDDEVLRAYTSNPSMPKSTDSSVIGADVRSILERHGKNIPIEPAVVEQETNADGEEWVDAGALFDRHMDELEAQERAQHRTELDGLFQDMKKHKYYLHAVICHLGVTAKSGHYWVWIFDFDKNIWRKYNDTTVEERADTAALLEELSTKGEPYYLMYVRDEDKMDLVSVPGRILQEATGVADDVEMVDHVENADADLPPAYTE